MESPHTENWPARLWLVRHGESMGNVALRHARSKGHHRIELTTRDMDVPLSPLGERQAEAVGLWLGANTEAPDAILTSPYLRARHTCTLLAKAAGWRTSIIPDERLREKEFGIIDALTSAGVMSQHPEQATFRKSLGKFYHRAPAWRGFARAVSSQCKPRFGPSESTRAPARDSPGGLRPSVTSRAIFWRKFHA